MYMYICIFTFIYVHGVCVCVFFTFSVSRSIAWTNRGGSFQRVKGSFKKQGRLQKLGYKAHAQCQLSWSMQIPWHLVASLSDDIFVCCPHEGQHGRKYWQPCTFDAKNHVPFQFWLDLRANYPPKLDVSNAVQLFHCKMCHTLGKLHWSKIAIFGHCILNFWLHSN